MAGDIAVAEPRLHHRQVDALFRPQVVGDATLVEPVDATRLEVREVVRVVDDPHEIGLAEADPQLEARGEVDGARRLGAVGRRRVLHRAAQLTSPRRT